MEVSVLSRYAAVLAWFLMSLGIAVVASGCSSSKSSSPGLLEQNGIKNVGDLTSIVIEVPEAKGSYLITDKTTVSRVYQLLNTAKRVSGMSKYMRPDTVTLIRKNGSTLSFAFGLYNPNLTWQYSSRPFVEFVKTELVRGGNYQYKGQLPTFSINQIAKIAGSGKRTTLPSGKVVDLSTVVRVVTSAYKPYRSMTETSTWNDIARFCTSANPGIEVVLGKPFQFQTLIGSTGPEPPQGSTALSVVALTVDRMLIYQGENQDLWLAFHSTAGKSGWYIADQFGQGELQGRTASSIYQELVSSAK